MKASKKLLALLLSLIMVVAMIVPAMAAEEDIMLISNNPDEAGKIVILHTNDVHCSINDYTKVAAYRDEMAAIYGAENVVLVDAGDAVQGGPIGTLTKGEYLVNIMNQVGYDYITLGNHEFDYEVPRMKELMEKQNATVLSSNFVDLATNKAVFKGYEIASYGDVKVAFVGITTPESFTKSTPAYFQNENGEYIYSFCEGNSGADLYTNVQASVDAAKAEGADYVIAIGHLGIEETSAPWRSTDVIANTTGIDALIDGHSHSTINGDKIANKNGAEVLLNQTGTKLANIGKVVIDTEAKTVTAEVISLKDYAGVNEETKAFIDNVNTEFEAVLNEVVAKTDVTLTTLKADGSRAIRSQETNLGDLCADAYRTILEADVAFVNGGGIRADIANGDVTYGQIINVHPYSNQATSIKVTGQQLLDALEMGAKNAPGESGGFMQVSGLTYSIDTTIPCSITTDDKGNFVSVDGAYRVKDVKVGGEALVLDKEYVLASHDYMLLNAGDGMTMFKGAEVIKDRVMPDNEILIKYIVEKLGGTVGEAYAAPQGRIKIVTEAEQPAEPTVPEEANAVEVTAYMLNVRAEAAAGTKIVKAVNKGDVLSITETKNGWGKLADGSGWVDLSFTKPAGEQPAEPEQPANPAEGSVEVTAYALNVRTGPGVDNKVSSVVRQGDVLEISETHNGWGKLANSDGWIYLSYTKPA